MGAALAGGRRRGCGASGVDLAVLFPNSFRSGLVAWLGGCRRRVGYARYGRARLLTDALEPVRDAAGQARCPARSSTPTTCLAETGRLSAAVIPHGAVHDGRATRQAADDGLAGRRSAPLPGSDLSEPGGGLRLGQALARRITSPPWPQISWTGAAAACWCCAGRPSATLARQIAAAGAERPGRLFAGASQPLSLGLTKACVRRADLLITTDSGPRHFAAAFDRPVVTLFGPTHIAWTETYYPRAVHLQKKVECGPCQLRVCPLDHRCMKLLTPAEVFAAAEQLLARCPMERVMRVG